VPDENPSGLGAFEFSLRFAGQYADKETNLNYNHFRDFDSTVGRYIESDPNAPGGECIAHAQRNRCFGRGIGECGNDNACQERMRFLINFYAGVGRIECGRAMQ